ncbi:hypothetical protein BRD56_12245 [Thermoplasmatales archaeon SW_10_69_26]|nr:MAG: hypothetical protein BRD56_12245 [Thermoplasmatales archaeon SW_10_69_26]
MRASFTGSIHENDASWASGDETVTIAHEGGEAVPVASLAIVIEITGTETRFQQGGSTPLDHDRQDAFTASDRTFTIGERWRSTNSPFRPSPASPSP